MKIDALPQVEFDSFPTDQRTKICIFTKPPYPIPDLSHIKDSRQLALYCTESTVLTIGRLAKRLPFELFRVLPTGNYWNKIDSTEVDGLDTPFRVACLPTGSVSDSVMLMIFSLNDPKKITLYTGTFQNCREVLISDLFLKYKKFITDIYVDNTLANSKHVDVIQNATACNDIKKIINTYPEHKIHLQIEMFDRLDFLVELAQRLQVNLKLQMLQQIFFYKTKYKHLFRYDAQIPNAADLNKKFQFKNQREICVIPYETADIEAYKWNFYNEKIINIRLIASERRIEVTPNTVEKGLIYITYADHAGASTLHAFFLAMIPKRIHPIVDDRLIENPTSKIPAEIFNDDCTIVYDSIFQSRNHLDVTLCDIRPAPKKRSFLDITVLSGLTDDSISNSGESNQNQTPQSPKISDESSDASEPVIFEISDDESVTMPDMNKTANKKRPPAKSDDHSQAKYFKLSDTNGNEIEAMPKKPINMQMKSANEPAKNALNICNKIMATDDVDNDYDDVSSLSSKSLAPLVFPDK